jgi:hypothetical protein
MAEKYYDIDDSAYIKRRLTNFKMNNDDSKLFTKVNTEKYTVGLILNEFDKMMNEFGDIDLNGLDNIDLNALDDIDLDDSLETNTFFCSFSKYKVGGKNVYIIGELHGSHPFEEDRRKKLLSDIEELLSFRIDVAFFEYGLRHTSIGKLFNQVLMKRKVKVEDYDMRIVYGVRQDLYRPNHKDVMIMYLKLLSEKYEPMFFKERYKQLCQDLLVDLLGSDEKKIIVNLFELNTLLYDVTNLENILECKDKNILIYCGQAHAKNIGKLIEKNG